MYKVSVIVPVYNNEKFVERCIRSLIAQTWTNLEIIVVDDGSSDRSGDILDSLGREDGRVKVFHRRNTGVGNARNFGLEKADGQYLTFVDGDDYVLPEYIGHMIQVAEEKDADMVICGVRYVEENGRTIKKLIPHVYESGKREEWTFRISAVWSHLYKREIWNRYDIRFSENERGEDMPIALFFSAVCRNITVLPEDNYCYVQHGGSAMKNFRGLRRYSLPYRSLEDAIRLVKKTGVRNGRSFHELFVVRILCTFYFDLAWGATGKDMDGVCSYIERILSTYYPDIRNNKLCRLHSTVQVPFVQKAAVWLLVFLTDRGKLRQFGRLLERKDRKGRQ